MNRVKSFGYFIHHCTSEMISCADTLTGVTGPLKSALLCISSESTAHEALHIPLQIKNKRRRFECFNECQGKRLCLEPR